MHFLIALAASAFFSFASSDADSEALARQAAMNASEDFASCFAYFRIVSVGMANSDRSDLEEGFEELSDTALFFGLEFARLAGLVDEAFSASADMALQNQIARIDGNTSNLAILNRDYMGMCEAAMRDPASRIQYWSDHLVRLRQGD